MEDDKAIEALAANLDPDNKIMAAQDFRHTIYSLRENLCLILLF